MKRSLQIAIITSILLIGGTLSAQESIEGARAKNGLAYDLVSEGPLVVLIHGTNLDRRLWNEEIKWMQERAQVLRYDLRGQGESPFPEEPYGNHEDLIELLIELDAKKVTLIGLSAGAQVALDVALERPDLVKRMVLASPSLDRFSPKVMPPYLEELVKALQSGDFDQANEILLASSLLAVPAHHKELVRAMAEKNAVIWKIPFSLVKMARPPAINRLEELDVPTLVLVGENDMAAVHEIGDVLLEKIPGSKRITIPDGGHLLNLTSPEAFRKEVSAFLDESKD
jgi:pimeloyl-ACP methyl ester carboxylesterase